MVDLDIKFKNEDEEENYEKDENPKDTEAEDTDIEAESPTDDEVSEDDEKDIIEEEDDFKEDNSEKDESKKKDNHSAKKKFDWKEIKKKLNIFFSNKKNRLIIIISICVIILVLFALGFYFMLHGKPTKDLSNANDNSNQSAQQKEVLYQALLDGMMVSREASERHPVAVIVENHVDARPQSGLDKASIVYEALAEGGITRFMALFGTNEAEKVGPVRSARTYFVDWSHGYSAFLAHVGGNIDALEKISAEKIYDLDQMGIGEPTFWRVAGAGLATEHTMYTSTPRLREEAKQAKYPSSNNFTVYKFKDDPAGTEKDALPTNQKITVNFSNAKYNVSFQYDKETNSYKRFLAGAAHVDKVSKDQIVPKNLVVMTVAAKPTITRINEQGLDMTTIGTGKAKIFLDGKAIDGTWKKDSKVDREVFYDEKGQEIIFNRGQLWICAVPTDIAPIVEQQ